MSLVNNIQNFQHDREWYNLTGHLEYAKNNQIKIIPVIHQEDIFALVNQDSIKDESLKIIVHGHPVNSIIPFQIKKGTKVELHYKNLEYNFKLDPNERSFYIDQDLEQVVFLDELNENYNHGNIDNNGEVTIFSADPCCQYVHLTLSGCCSTNKSPGFTVGWVDCSSPAEPSNIGCWHNDHCCP